ncbi:MAG TPA: Nif3-like dinuclear metal center hexameric protein [Anaerolineales bacterium]|nr:Nif3-like dinuclear metal center hexameric protein [Anaerolineales bacterium]
MKLRELTCYLDEYLRIAEIEDTSQNGLQVEGPEEVTKVAFAVDGCLAAFEQAVEAGAQLLIVHHGLFWDKPLRLVGPRFRRVQTLIQGGCGLYAVHLPLDAHPEVGNSAELARLLSLQETRPFGKYHGMEVGIAGVLEPPLEIAALIGRLIQALTVPPIRVLAHGPEKAHRVGCISGFAVSMIEQVEEAGLDTFITGETSHSFFHQAAERGLNVLFAGHYATETLGVQALARHLEEKFGLETAFLNIPTGM